MMMMAIWLVTARYAEIMLFTCRHERYASIRVIDITDVSCCRYAMMLRAHGYADAATLSMFYAIIRLVMLMLYVTPR